MRRRSVNKDLGSILKAVFSLIIFFILFHFFGTSIFSAVISGLVSVISYRLVGVVLRATGVWWY